MFISEQRTFRHLLLAATIVASPLVLALPQAAQAQVVLGVSIVIAPPLLPVYVQPPMPDVGYIWTPGYWAYGQVGYYWVPGTWIQPPMVGVLWTPPYWGWVAGAYLFHAGYWGPSVGFYGGIDYGFGYNGIGFFGGEWRDGAFFYNRAAWNLGGVRITNVFDRPFAHPAIAARFSFNGPGGVLRAATREELAAAHERHVAATEAQIAHVREAAANRDLRFAENHGRPAIAATPRPGEFRGAGVVRASEAARPGEAVRPGEEARPGEAGRVGEPGRPGVAPRPAGMAHTGTAVHPGTRVRPSGAVHSGEVSHPAEAARPEPQVHEPAAAHPRPEAHAAMPHAAPRPPAAPHPAAPHPAPAHAGGGKPEGHK